MTEYEFKTNYFDYKTNDRVNNDDICRFLQINRKLRDNYCLRCFGPDNQISVNLVDPTSPDIYHLRDYFLVDLKRSGIILEN